MKATRGRLTTLTRRGGHRRCHEARGAAGSKDGFGLPRRLRWLHKLRVGRPRERSKIAALDLFRYRSRTDEALMIIAAVLSAANGIMMPMSTVLFGSLVQQLNSPHRAELHSTTFTHNQLHAFTHPGDADWTQWKEAAASSVDVSNPLLFLRWSRSLLSFLTFYVLIGGMAMLTGGAVNALLPTTLPTTTVHCRTALLPLPYYPAHRVRRGGAMDDHLGAAAAPSTGALPTRRAAPGDGLVRRE